MKVNRREFLKLLGTVGIVGAVGGALPPVVKYITPPIPKEQPYPRSKLVWEDGSPVKASELEVNVMYKFYYPAKDDTPNMLLNLGDENGNPIEIPPARLPKMMDPIEEPPIIFRIEGNKVTIGEIPGRGGFYEFPGGVGPNRSIIAYSGICQHFKCAIPALAFYKPGRAPPLAVSNIAGKGGVVFCSCHGSIYDPYRGAIVLRAPAPRPLPVVILEWDPTTDELTAIGMAGPTVMGMFCNTCVEPDKLVGNKTVVTRVPGF
ncbi:MAG: Rieske 2Fe-2S domain-containing protein [Desulfurococcales archaeon]|nr:Rieske 2Fe-2S domain-containing protein [Desulfurococcales archaeon]